MPPAAVIVVSAWAGAWADVRLYLGGWQAGSTQGSTAGETLKCYVFHHSMRPPPGGLGKTYICGGNGLLVWVWGTVPAFLKHLCSEMVGFDDLVPACPILSLGVVVFGGDEKRPYGSRGVSKMDPVLFIRGL